ncbi:nascent polypeptide-associated complex subunit alpha, muscle-specific form-like [Lynx canadensis]|uniref:nascent polypeptide-associated complex subunit alpha, muscle-specific form-like n=1 Tax=Lynx canadensis TaxID=61383 RepID=UPI0013C45B00|nr:nascent polypeptide-associated complex subunit alpha, muscle-specific form-like [Lynx canadensis]
MAPVSPPRAPATAAPASTARPASTPVPLASTGLAARWRVSVSTEPPATPSAASVSAPPASTASSARGGVKQAHLERAAASTVTARPGHPATPSPASAFAPQGAQGPPVTVTADRASLGQAVPCAVAAELGPVVTPSMGSATAWTATLGPPASKRPCNRPLTDQHLGSAAGHRNTSAEAAVKQARLPGALATTEEGAHRPGLQPQPRPRGPCAATQPLALQGSAGTGREALAGPTARSPDEWTGPIGCTC